MRTIKRTRIKMCGTTRAEDAMAAVTYGIDALGFIFAKKSQRCVTRSQAYEIIKVLPSFITTVGVFVDSDIEQVKETVEECGLTQVQLHGNETTNFCSELRKWSKSLSICKVFRVGEGSPDIDIIGYERVIDSLLLDTYVKGAPGGTGVSFDWSLMGSLELKIPMVLAGGLGPDNIREAVEKVVPFAVDINSGVEQSPGIKDHKKLETVVRFVRESDDY